MVFLRMSLWEVVIGISKARLGSQEQAQGQNEMHSVVHLDK